MIPRIIHQTWRDETIPERFAAWSRSWRDLNPGWEYRLWTDADLDELVARHYPHFLEQFRAYPRNIERADAGRYLVLHRCGGLYADLDTRCLAPLEPIVGDDRVILSREPDSHALDQAPPRGMPYLMFNGVMASPRAHPFWEHVLAKLVACRHARDTLDATGPCVLTGAVLTSPDPAGLALHSCHLFNPIDVHEAQCPSPAFGAYAPTRFAIHYWAGTWYAPYREKRWQRTKAWLRGWRHRATRGEVLTPEAARAAVDADLIGRRAPPSDRPETRNVAVLIPVRDAERHLPRCLELLDALDHPAERTRVVFCEGDSGDGTRAALERALPDLNRRFSEACLVTLDLGPFDLKGKRWKPELQRERRARIARVRNHLIRHGLHADDDWALWIDADVCDYPPDVLHRLLAVGERIVVPNCVLEPGGPSFDLNSFLEFGPRPLTYYKHCRDGLFQPPADYVGRRHLHDLRYLDRTNLTGVGGTMLLVQADVHRAGIVFPEIPYDDLIETEGFGKLACDRGIMPVGLPNLEIRHVPE